MKPRSEPLLLPRIRDAIAELQVLVRSQYPEAAFRIIGSPDDAEGVYLIATVDVEEPDLILDAVVDRVIEMQVEEDLPVHVVPVRPSRSEETSTIVASGLGHA